MGELFKFDRISDPDMELAPLPDEGRAKWLLQAEDLLFARQSLTVAGAGRCILVLPASIDRTFESHIIRVRLNQEVSSSAFYYYFFRSSVGRGVMETIVEAVAAAGIRASDLGRLLVPRPPLDEQRRIAEVLGALDDLIDTNERLSASSVALARAEFRRRFPSFAESPTNPVPFTQLVDVLSGGTPRTSEDRYWDGEIPWFSIADAPGENQPWVIDTSKHVSELGLQNSPASLLDVGTVILTARGTVGKVAMIGAPMAINQSCYGLRSRSGTSGCFEFLATESLVNRLRTASHGSVFDTITRQTLERTYVQDIPQSERNGFDSAVRPLLDACRDLAFENAQLRRTRDELLPLLMSGTVRVRPEGVGA